jgi:signal transduction histidine kinase
LGQELSALRYALGFTRRRFLADPPAIAANLEELERLLDQTAATTRHIVTELRPRILDDLGLCAAVEWLVQRSAERTGLSIKLRIDGQDKMISDEVKSATFRILQEALTNVARHAQAQTVHTLLSISEDQLELTIRDDGIGLQQKRKGGMGMIGMRERALSLGGKLRFASNADGGTTVSLHLPLKASLKEEREE